MELSLSRTTVSLTVLVVVICTVDATMNYLAFPRMGRSALTVDEDAKRDGMPWNIIFPRKRASFPSVFILPRKRDALDKTGYLAFPRMGRSQAKAATETPNCCGVGLKSEFSVSDDGKEELRNICTASLMVCCDGLREIADEKPDGVVYSMCVPSGSTYSDSLKKLKRIFANK